MTLDDKLRQRRTGLTGLRETQAAEETTELRLVRASNPEAIADLKQRVHSALLERLGGRLFDSSLTEAQLKDNVSREIERIMIEEAAPLSDEERRGLVAEIRDDILGLGPIEPLLHDPTITEIMVTADGPIFIEREGLILKTRSRFLSSDHLRRVIERIVSDVGRRVDESSPMVDARLPDGSRVNAIIPPLSVDGPSLTIRRFSKDPFGVDDLVAFGTLTPESAQCLAACVEGKLNVLISGGTGTGKTTFLNVVSSFVPPEERIVTIEDAVELRLGQPHVVRLESRPANIEGRGEVTIRDLVRNSLRMRPDRIIVGEVRGAEALDMLQAMNTGHEGSLSTVHANSPRDALARIETMVLYAGIDLPVRAIREQAASALDLIVHLNRMRDGTRRVTKIVEVVGMEGDQITLNEVFNFDFAAGVDDQGHSLGRLRPTGVRPRFASKLAEHGVELPVGLFDEWNVADLNVRGGRR